MAEWIACVHGGEVEVLREGQAPQRVESAHRRRLAAAREGAAPRIVSVTRGRALGELCYAVSSSAGCDVLAHVPGTYQEQQLFHGVDARLNELDFGLADQALACAVSGAHGTSAIGVFSDDGRGLRTVTEGDVIDRAPRWAPGGRGEIVYASAGIGRTKAGKAVRRSPFALHLLRFSDSSVEILVSDARYDYMAGVPVSEQLLYALRANYEADLPASPSSRISGLLADFPWPFARARPSNSQPCELVRMSAQNAHVVARDVFAFDVAQNETVVYASQAGIFRLASGQSTPELLASLSHVEQLVICC